MYYLIYGIKNSGILFTYHDPMGTIRREAVTNDAAVYLALEHLKPYPSRRAEVNYTMQLVPWIRPLHALRKTCDCRVP